MKALLGIMGIVVLAGLWLAHNRSVSSTVPDEPAGIVQEAARSKGGAPLTINFVPGKALSSGQRPATIILTPEAPCAHVEVVATAAEGLQIDGGAKIEWKLAVEKGVAAKRDVVLTVTAAGGHRIAVTATMCGGDGSRQTAVAAFFLNAEGRLRPAFDTRHPGSRLVDGPDKQKILEMPAGEPEGK